MATDTRQRRPETDPADRLAGLLHRRTDDGPLFTKSKYLAEDLAMTPSQVGQLLASLRESRTDLVVEPWSYSNATTWRIDRSE